MRRRAKTKPTEPKPAAIPEKLARPFESAIKALKAEQALRAEQEAKALADSEARAALERARLAEAHAAAAARLEASRAARGKTTAQGASARRGADPVAGYGYDDRTAFHQAYAQVRPLHGKKTQRQSGQTTPVGADERRERELARLRVDEAEDRARARLDALVAGSVRFFLDRDADGAVYARRSDVPDRLLDALTGPKVAPRARLDLHGLDEESARRETVRFVREQLERKVRDVLVVHGKGHHSSGGVGVLDQAVVRALTESAIAPKVMAFVSAPLRLGGLGAMLVRLDV